MTKANVRDLDNSFEAAQALPKIVASYKSDSNKARWIIQFERALSNAEEKCIRDIGMSVRDWARGVIFSIEFLAKKSAKDSGRKSVTLEIAIDRSRNALLPLKEIVELVLAKLREYILPAIAIKMV